MKNPKPAPKYIEEELDWAYSIYPELEKKYPDMWIAVFGKKVLSYGKSLKKVLEKARAKTGLRDIPHLFVEKGIHIYEN